MVNSTYAVKSTPTALSVSFKYSCICCRHIILWGYTESLACSPILVIYIFSYVIHKNHNSAFDTLELFPFDHWHCYFVSALLNLIIVRGISTKLHTFVTFRRHVTHKNHNSALDIFGVISLLIICNVFSCPLYNLITVRCISTKLHTFVKHIQMTCYAQEP